MPNTLIIYKKPSLLFEIPAPPEPSLKPTYLNTLLTYYLTAPAPPAPFSQLGKTGPYPPIANILATELTHEM